MRHIVYASIGAGAGATVAVLAVAVAKLLADAARAIWGEIPAWFAHPIAVVIAAIAGQRLQAELSILLHIVAIVITFMIVGTVVGLVISRS